MMEEQLIALLEAALKKRVSDIHLKVEQEEVQIQFRQHQEMIDGPKDSCSLRLFRYLQYRANLDISTIFLPQTGQFEIEVQGKHLALRFAVLSSLGVISGVLRILNADFDLKPQDLTFQRGAAEQLKKMLDRKNGLVLISGPTGSGKTTTLYTLLNHIEGRKIFTLEDPIEIYNRRYVQLQINEKQHLDYEEGVRQLLRHDPDIIVIGEIRDEQAAKMAVRCALTGHLVVSTIHSFSCQSAVERMLELKVGTGQLRDVLWAVSNQRLYSMKNKKGKIGVYEIMQKAQLESVFEHTLPEGFVSLQSAIEEGIRKGILTQKQTRGDRF